MTEAKKRKYSAEEEALFFYWLGHRLFVSALRGHVIGHRRPLSAARDYLRMESVPEGVERDACEFLVDVSKIGRAGGPSLEDVFDRWSESADWRPTP